MSSARLFVDTSVLAYLYDAEGARKRGIVQNLIAEHADAMVISTQVLIEIFNVCTTKFGMSAVAAESAVKTLSRLAVASADRQLVVSAASIAAANQLSIFDAAIVSAAKRSECSTLLAEDGDFSGEVEGLNVVNPFEVNDGF